MRASRRVPLALLCCLLWGSAVPSIKLSMGLFSVTADAYASQIFIGGLRFTLAGLGAVAICALRAGHWIWPGKQGAKAALGLSMFQTVGQYVVYYIGVSNASGVNASVVQSSNVFIAFLISALIFRQERFTLTKLLGCLLGFAGILVMYAGSLGGHGNFTFMGEGMVLLSTISAATSVCLLKKLSGAYSPVLLSGYQFIFGGAIMLLGGGLTGGSVPNPSPAGLGILLYLAFVSSAAYSVWGYLLQHNPVSAVAIFGCTTPVFGALLSCLLLGEGSRIGWNLAGELLCVILSIVLVSRGGGRKTVPAVPIPDAPA